MPPPAQPSNGNACSNCISSFFGCIKTAKIEKVMNIIRVCNILNGGFLIFAGVWGYINLTDAAYIIYLATYIGLFGFMVIAFEVRWKKIENKMRRNFGFMFSPYGRTMFFMFAATLCWAIDLWLPILVGVATCISALLQCTIFCIHPDFKTYSAVKKTDDPSNLPEDELIAYLKTHPEVAQGAVNQSPFPAQPAARPAPAAPPARRAPAPSAPPTRKPAPAPRRSAPSPTPSRPLPRKSSSAAPPPPAPRSSTQSDNPFDL